METDLKFFPSKFLFGFQSSKLPLLPEWNKRISDASIFIFPRLTSKCCTKATAFEISFSFQFINFPPLYIISMHVFHQYWVWRYICALVKKKTPKEQSWCDCRLKKILVWWLPGWGEQNNSATLTAFPGVSEDEHVESFGEVRFWAKVFCPRVDPDRQLSSPG